MEMLDRRIGPVRWIQPAAAVPRPGRVRVERQCFFEHASGDLVVANDRMGRPQHCEDGRILAAERGRRAQAQRLAARRRSAVVEGGTTRRAKGLADSRARSRSPGRAASAPMARVAATTRRIGRSTSHRHRGSPALAARPLDLGRANRWLNGPTTDGNSVLQVEDVRDGAFVPVCPEMVTGRSVDQLGGDANAVPDLRTLPSIR